MFYEVFLFIHKFDCSFRLLVFMNGFYVHFFGKKQVLALQCALVSPTTCGGFEK